MSTVFRNCFQACILINEGVRPVWMSGPYRVAELFHFLFTFYIDDVIVRLKYYRSFRLKTTWGLNMNIVWHVSLRIQFGFFCLPVLIAFEPVDYWRKRTWLDAHSSLADTRRWHVLHRAMHLHRGHRALHRITRCLPGPSRCCCCQLPRYLVLLWWVFL